MARKKGASGTGSSRGLAAAGAVIGMGLVAVAVALLASTQANGFILEDLDSMREFLQHPSLAGLRAGCSEVWAIFGPGGRLHPGWFLEHKGHLVIEGLLMVTIAVMLLQSRFSPKATEEEDGLTEKEIDQLCAEWEPHPLVPDVPEEEQLPEPPIVERDGSTFNVKVNGHPALNLACSDFLGLGDDPVVQARARETVERYGVGSCGPRGFYGTFDVHLDLEKALAKFMGQEEAIIYSYDISTIASVIPAFASRQDLVVIDDGASYPIQQGAKLSRARVRYFRHNDMQHLEQLLQQIEAEERDAGSPLCRKLIVVEGVYSNTGDVAPLQQLYRIKEQYKYRLCVEETYALGVLGATGRGACEAAGLSPGQVEVIVASMGTTLASVGGFCVGHHEVCDHQRLCGQGYCFSASLPPYLATAAHEALNVMGSNRGLQLAAEVRSSAAALRQQLTGVPGLLLSRGAAAGTNGSSTKNGGSNGSSGDGCVDAESPLVHLQLAPELVASAGSRKKADLLLQAVADRLLEKHGLLVAVPRYSNLDRVLPAPSIKLFVHAGLPNALVPKVASAVREAATHVLARLVQ